MATLKETLLKKIEEHRPRTGRLLKEFGDVKVGDEIIINPGLSCGRCEYCNRSEESLCESFGIVGFKV